MNAQLKRKQAPGSLNSMPANPRDWSIWSIGQFATLAGVTIRTLRFYDRKGLLRPAKISEAGYRLYSTNELLRLQHILTLKAIGCSLRTIQMVLEQTDNASVQLPELLAQQRCAVEAEIKNLQAVAQAIAAAEEQLQRLGEISYSSIHTILKVITMQPSKESQEWTKQFFTGEQHQALAEAMPSYMKNEAEGAKVAADWANLIAEVNAALNTDPASPTAQALADRWMVLVGLFTQGDKGRLNSLNTMYASTDNPNNPAPEDFQDFTAGMKPAMDFVQKALAARKS
jgi:MerR family transcriptional regulator, thiopeptide resistance regulator